MTIFINFSTSILTKKSSTFCTCLDNQPGVLFQVFEDERASTKDINLLGSAIPPAPGGALQTQVIYDNNVFGILNVSTSYKTTGKSYRTITIDNKGHLW